LSKNEEDVIILISAGFKMIYLTGIVDESSSILVDSAPKAY